MEKNEFSTGKQVKITLRIGFVAIGSNFNKLSHLLTMHPFSTPWKHQKAVVFCFQGVEKGWIGKEWVKNNLLLFLMLSGKMEVIDFLKIFTFYKESGYDPQVCINVPSFLSYSSDLLPNFKKSWKGRGYCVLIFS